MHAILLPNGNLLVPVEADDPEDGEGLAEIGPDHPDYGKWLPFAEEGEDPRTMQADVPPWERPGSVRRDYENDRGGLIQGLAIASIFASGLSVAIPYLSEWGPRVRGRPAYALAWVACAAGLPLAATALALGKADLRRIAAGTMDPFGRGKTDLGVRLAKGALFGCAIWGAVWTMILLSP